MTFVLAQVSWRRGGKCLFKAAVGEKELGGGLVDRACWN